MNFLENEFFLLAITFGIFFLAKLLQKKTGIMLLNPILLTIAILIIFLKMTNISYDTYNKGGHLIEFWLKPAVVALGVPLYLQLETIKKQLLPILLSQLDGSFRRDYLLAGSKIRYHPDSHGSYEINRRHSRTDRRRSGLRRSVGRNTRLQDNETHPYREPHGARTFLRGSRPCCRHVHSNGHQQQIRCVCQPRTDA